ncbi:ATP-binding cassette domain-containing protein [Octadecabacter sp. SW4]|uniref:ATP-binding cassette domain-containing protein n=1 Tax=Octadecabacter sp. SW4 TaxID=2602067 RepID=UPI0011C20851|nr:ATP-binding cassette domain-containing protein [Octadecabacter sp. SW4]QEE37129.1 ATP-binding cassette domain-containing protein [Octadecabacter sp. SW4]
MLKGLELRNVVISHNDRRLVAIDITVAAGEVLSVMGPSGAGKSTLLAMITGNLAPEFRASGEVWLDGMNITDLPTHQRRVGILFQDDLLFPHLSVGANLAFGLRAGGSKQERAAKINEALREVDLEGYADRDPATLSGGQKARVALMRMLLAEPCVLLLDEAFSRLDTALRTQVRDLVFARARVRNLPVVMVTHDLEDAKAAGGTVFTIAPHED